MERIKIREMEIFYELEGTRLNPLDIKSKINTTEFEMGKFRT